MLARPLHEGYRIASRQACFCNTSILESHLHRSSSCKADNVAAAERIPYVLGLGGLSVVLEDVDSDLSPEEVKKRIKSNLELFAEAEHDGWMDYRLINRWKYGPKRDDARRIHPLLVPYAALTEDAKDKDRDAVRNYPEILASVNYKVTVHGHETGRV